MERDITAQKTGWTWNQCFEPHRRSKHPTEVMRSSHGRSQKQVDKPGLHSSHEAGPERAKDTSRESYKRKAHGLRKMEGETAQK